MKYRLIVFDIDGTIREPGFEISNRLKQTTQILQNRGLILTLATGRSLQSAQQFVEKLEITCPIIVSQGSIIWDPKNESILREVNMEPKMVRMAIESLKDYKIDVLVFLRDKILVSKITPWISNYSKRTNIKIEIIGDLNDAIYANPLRVLAVGDESIITYISNKLNSAIHPKLYVTKSLPMFCEILHPDGGKGSALEWLSNLLKINLSQTIVFGNGLDDIDMVNKSGLGVSIAGSPFELIKGSDLVACSVKSNGVAKVLESLIENGDLR